MQKSPFLPFHAHCTVPFAIIASAFVLTQFGKSLRTYQPKGYHT